MRNARELLNRYIALLLSEARLREADISDGSRVPWGSDAHVNDLERRISEMSAWRDRQKKGSEARANYSRIVQRLKTELKSARRSATARTLQEKQRKTQK
jgi:hypothetical protein